jgi:hypothetical protein
VAAYVKEALQEMPMPPAALPKPVKYAGRSYLIEIVVATALYVAAVQFRPWLAAQAATTALAAAAKVLPALPIWLTLWVVWRYYRRIDEFEQLKMLKTTAVAFGVGSCLIVTYTFLADAGLPPLALTWAWPTLAVTWAITQAILSIAEHK